MFNFFKRSTSTTVKPAAKPGTRPTVSKLGDGQGLPDPLPIPEAAEGNEDSDGALWEDSVAYQDSQLQPLTFPARPPQKQASTADAAPEFDDVFASVRKNAP